MADPSDLSNVKRSLLQRYLSGDAAGTSEHKDRITPRPPGNIAPLSLAQEQVWVHGQMAPAGVSVYNETLTIRRTGPLNLPALERTFAEIIRRHEIWRTTFELHEGQPVQIIHPAENSFHLPSIDLRNIPESERERAAVQIARAAARAPFDLRTGPLLRAILVRLDEVDHRLFLTFHQLVFDGVTAYQVFLPELTGIYRAFSKNEPSPLPEPGIQYSDYAVWQRERPKPDVTARQLDYWKSKLAGELPVLEWPSGQLRPALQTYRGEIETAVMPQDLLQKLKILGEQEHVSLFMILVAGLACVLHRYTGQVDIILGAPSAGRPRPELEKVPGYFLNILPLRIDVSGNPTFHELLMRVRETVLGALSNSDISFTQLLDAVRPVSDPSRNSFFQVAISVEPPIPLVDSGWNATQSDIATGASKLDLYIDVDERSDGIVGPVTYNPDIFDADVIGRLIQHWRTLLEGAAARPDHRLAELPLLTAQERKQILVQWNDTGSAYSQTCIHEVFERQVERSPNSVAVKYQESSLSYREVNERANQLAWFLQKRGVGPEVPVGLCIDRGLEMVIALLGILKAGGAYVPLGLELPDERLGFMLADARPLMVLTKRGLQHNLLGKDAIFLDDNSAVIARERKENLKSAVGPQNRAYVIYTSGSTGVPKGVEGTHRASMNRFSWMWRTYPFQPGEVCCQKTNLGFVDSIWEIFGPLLAGIPNVIVPQDAVRDPEELLRLLARERVTRIVLVPSLLRTLLDRAPNLQPRVPELKLWSCSGEVLPIDLAKRFREAFPEAMLLNIYGSSEVAADVTYHEVSSRDLSSSVAIGKPISNTQIYLVDEYHEPVPIGVRGQIFVGGDGVARGYLNRPELTAERFVENWLALEKSPRLYRTGDLGRFRSNGEIEYLGRVDRQIKLRGLRIELGEIETVLASHAGIREAVVAVTGEGDQQKLAAYFVVNEHEAAPAAVELRRYLRTKLPEYMVPASYWKMDALPLLPSGKLNRAALAASGATLLVDRAELRLPQNKVEAKLSEIWRELLQLDQVGTEQNFFELGGHSLLALQVTARVRRIFEVELPVRTLFEAPTIVGLAAEVEKAELMGLKARSPILQNRRQAAPAGASQEALLIQLEKLPAQEVRNLLKKMLEGKQDYGFRS